MRYALDTETGPFDPSIKQANAYALEPYRKEFYVKQVCLVGASIKTVVQSSQDTRNLLAALVSPVIYCHNAIFDISVLIRHVGYDAIKHIEWRDTGLLAKWLNNSQEDEHFRYSLRNCIERWLSEHPDTVEFLGIKDNMLNDEDYWLQRVILDTSMTLELAKKLEQLLPIEQASGFITECKCLLPLARGYMQGIQIDEDVVEEMRMTYSARVAAGLRELGVEKTVVSSPTQLSDLLFNKWGLSPAGVTPSGNPSTSAPNLKIILHKTQDGRLQKLLDVKSAMTVLSKYANGFIKTIDYIGEPVMHPSPRLFNSYTGRMTYSSKMLKKYQVGIALHQLPRKDKIVKKAMVAPKGYKFVYADFAAQELRLMAQHSKDEVMIQAFRNEQDLHAITTETIYGIPYEEIVEKNKAGDEVIVDNRNCGKLTNLSCMYRIGAPSLQKKFFADYNINITVREASHYKNSFIKAYRGVPLYWEKSIRLASKLGYSESLMSRRFTISKLDWQGESSAINQPIQGSGADLAEIVIGEVHKEFPDSIFQVAVHDSLTWLIKEDSDHKELQQFIENIDFDKYMNQKLLLTFPMDFTVGTDLANMEPF